MPFDFNCGFVGYLGYELKGDCGGSLVHRSPLPDAAFVFADRLVVFDHDDECTYLLCLTDGEGPDDGERWVDDVAQLLEALVVLGPTTGDPGTPRRQHLDFFPQPGILRPTYPTSLTASQHLTDGETYEVCLTNKVKTDVVLDPLPLYRVLRRVNPAPFSAFLRFDGAAVAQLLARAISPHPPRPVGRNEADQGDDSPRRDPRGGSRAQRGAADEREEPGREPHDHRSPPQRPRHGLRDRQRPRAPPDGDRDVRDRPPDGLHDQGAPAGGPRRPRTAFAPASQAAR